MVSLCVITAPHEQVGISRSPEWRLPLCVVMCEVSTLAAIVCLQARALECSGGNETNQEVLKPVRTDIMTDLNS